MSDLATRRRMAGGQWRPWFRRLGFALLGSLPALALAGGSVSAGDASLPLPEMRRGLDLISTSTNEAPFFRLRLRQPDDAGPLTESDDSLTNLAEIRIGWFGPSSPDDPANGPLWWAANLAIQEANQQGGFQGRPFRLIPKWSENPWGNGVPQVFRLVYEDQVRALLGGMDGASTHLAEQVVAKAGLPLLSPVSTDPSVNLAGVPWVFSCAPSDEALAPLLARAVVAELERAAGRFVVLAATDHDSRIADKQILKALRERRRSPDLRIEFPAGLAPADSQLGALAEVKPRVVLIVAGPEDSARWLVTLRGRSTETVVFGTHQMGRSRFLQLAGEAAEGVRFPLLATGNSSPAAEELAAGFKARFHYDPDHAVLLTYDAARLLVAAVCRGGPGRGHVREALLQLSPWPGLAGPIQWDPTGQNIRSVSGMGTIHKGRIRPCVEPPE